MCKVVLGAAAAGHSTGRPASEAEMFEYHQLRNHQRTSFSKPARSASIPVASAETSLLSLPFAYKGVAKQGGRQKGWAYFAGVVQ